MKNVQIDDKFVQNENIIPDIGSENVKHEPAEPSKSKFRIYSKRLFLTYSRTNLSCIDVLNQLRKKFSCIEFYAISQEEHADEPEKGKHIHAYVEFNKKVNILSAQKLDLVDTLSNKVIHGEYQSVKNKQNVIDYVKKDGPYITNIETKLDFEINLQKICLEKGLSSAMEYFCERKPELVSSKYNSVKSNLKSFLDLKKQKIVPKHSNFNYPKEILDWFSNLKDEKTLFLTGQSGVGKTSGIVSLLNEYNPLLIRDLNGLKNLREDNKALIFDDLDWNNISRETKIHLLDKEFDSQIRILYAVVDLPSKIIKVITSNNPHDLLRTFEADKAIERRIVHVNIDEPIYSLQQNNIFINFNIQNHQ
jgi:hypothetical protein